jgi:hypothetical protein
MHRPAFSLHHNIARKPLPAPAELRSSLTFGQMETRLLSWKIVGYCSPCIAILAVIIFLDPNATGDRRPLLWLVPISFFTSGIVLWRAFVKFPESFRWQAFLGGILAFLVGTLWALFLVLFDTPLRG